MACLQAPAFDAGVHDFPNRLSKVQGNRYVAY